MSFKNCLANSCWVRSHPHMSDQSSFRVSLLFHSWVFPLDVEKMIEVLLLLQLIKSAETMGPGVDFENPDICASKESSVVFKCSYNYSDEETVRETGWQKGELWDNKWKRIQLSNLPSYQNRWKYLGDHQHNCSLALHNLQDNDTGYYYFWFDTNKYRRYSKGSVYLSVTELNASVYPETVKAEGNVTLKCQINCENSAIVWFRDGHPGAKAHFQAQAEDAGNYSCALEGHESVQSDPVALVVWYSPLNVSVEVSHVGPLTLGSDVKLTCNSAANPAADIYSWYMSSSKSSSPLLVGSGKVLSLSAVNPSHNAYYMCQAKNLAGENNSTAVQLKLEEAGVSYFILIGIGVKVILLLLLPLIVILAWRKCRNSTKDKDAESNDYENN